MKIYRRKCFRYITYQILNKTYFLYFAILFPLNLIVSIFLFFKLNFSEKRKKIIIRNDRLGDSILTLPFIFGSKNREEFYFVSDILDSILKQFKFQTNWKSFEFIDGNYNNIFIANLSCKKIETFKKFIPNKYLSLNIISQLSFYFSFDSGIPLMFTPNFASNFSQTSFINSSLKRIGIKTNPIKGIELLNQKIKCFENPYPNIKFVVIVSGLGIDNGRKMNSKFIKKIVKELISKSFIPILLEEPGFTKESKALAIENNIETEKCDNILDLFLLLSKARFVIGYDCGPMHIASLVSNSITLFSHVSPNQWGSHIWNLQLYEKTLKRNNQRLYYRKQINRGNNKDNWIIYKNKGNCPLHRKICSDEKCSRLDEDLIIEGINKIII